MTSLQVEPGVPRPLPLSIGTIPPLPGLPGVVVWNASPAIDIDDAQTKLRNKRRSDMIKSPEEPKSSGSCVKRA
ncbi:MAG: hypothetical protein DHS20C15_22670 [Planctomycetota bacterium]|nr:MAG: hypothetical protein DHS20C15_22670 [Planctomycetota bacterium]